MTALEELIQAAVTAPPERQQEALRLLQGRLPKPEPYLSLRELSLRTGFGVTSLRRWRVPSHDLGGRPRYRLTEVEAYLRSEAFQRRQAALRAERRSLRSLRALTPAVPGRAGVNGHRRPELNLKP